MTEETRIIETIRRVMPAVVSIAVMRNEEELKTELRAEARKKNAKPSGLEKLAVDIHGEVQVGGGSGFIVHSNGIILTNKHVVAERHGRYTAITNTNEQREAVILARDPMNDVAILKISAPEPLPVVTLAHDSIPRLGETVLAVGNALGIFKNTVSRGIISGLS